MEHYDFTGPSVFGYETDTVRRVASISVHTSPLATLGGKDAGGMNVYVRELSCHTARLGLPVDVFTRRTDPNAPDTISICPGVNLVNITAGPAAPVDKNQLFEYLPEFAEEMVLYSLRNGVRYDVVHAHYWLSGWVAHLLKRYWDTPFVQMFHTTAHMKNAVSPIGQHETALRARIESQLVGLADSLIAANPDERADLIWRQRTRAEKICTIPPGVDVDLFTARDRGICRAALEIPANERVVLFVGRVDPIKGIDTLLCTAAALDRAGTEATILFVGGDLDADGEPTGPLREVVAEASKLNVVSRFRFVGSQPQERLPLFYGAADAVVVPSRYESFGLVAVEAMACGRPVVASRAGGLTFTVEDGTTGYLAPVGDFGLFAEHLARILEDSDLRDRLGANAHESAQRFAWGSVAESVQHVYERLSAGQRANLCCPQEIFA
ncbi:MAG: D-inositol-3-phosphate glycosyltransferase [Thermomicrobiales bacterium]|nr:D-inositol-3-phosphate glycosyltransferase [Thermomicrobiales bacterium]